MSPPARLLQLHGVIVDLIYQVEAVPRPGGEARVYGSDMTPGGGFNAMVAAKRSGLDVRYGGAVGTGPLGDMVSAALSAEAIVGLRPRDPERDQGCCTVMVDRAGERTFVASSGAEGHLARQDLQRLPMRDFGWCLLSGYALYYEGSRAALTAWLEDAAPIPTLVFDPTPIARAIGPRALKAALARASWISANADEAHSLTGRSDPADAARHLAKGRTGGAVVRQGAEGCIVAWEGQAVRIPAHSVVAVDTNGAGDAHVGAFIAALARGQRPDQAALYANVAAALSTTRPGPATAPDLATIKDALRLPQAS